MHTKGKLGISKDGYTIFAGSEAFYVAQVHPFDPDGHANAQRLVKCWNEYDKEVERANLAEAALVKFEQLAAEEIAGFNALKAKADVCDELVEALKIHGEHSDKCYKNLTIGGFCDCGLEQALAKAERIE